MGEIPEHLLKRAAERKAQLEAEKNGAAAPSDSDATQPASEDTAASSSTTSAVF